MTIDLVLLFFALAAPLFLWPVEYFFPFPFIAEEIVKGGLIYFNDRLANSILVGFFFALSETGLYSFNLSSTDTFARDFFIRLAVTSALHISTVIVMSLLSSKSKYLLLPGILISILIHYFYNKFFGYPSVFTAIQ